jgi:hypothetical protein
MRRNIINFDLYPSSVAKRLDNDPCVSAQQCRNDNLQFKKKPLINVPSDIRLISTVSCFTGDFSTSCSPESILNH